jgi:acetoin utilization deacetylase AcuC-like enzyme
VRAEAASLKCVGLFFECLPDEPALCSSTTLAQQNAARLRFYERYGAVPIVGTAYETPLEPGQLDSPLLVFDDLGTGRPLLRDEARRIVRAILERRYAKLCPPEYNERIIRSIADDPVRVREPRYLRKATSLPTRRPDADVGRISLVVTEAHRIHHVRERGYVEAPVRIKVILDELEKTDLFEKIEPRRFPDHHITAVHDAGYVRYFRRITSEIGPNDTVYPYVFPIRNVARPPEDLAVRAGYYCIDTFTPLSQGAYAAARAAVDCTLTAATRVLDGHWLAYALVRPPGHHAERRWFGGFCYFNSAAIAAHYLSAHGRVAIVDVDYHHGNGQQDIFWERNDVFTLSIHGHPRFAYPYFSGFEDERGGGDGAGFNVNVPLPEAVDGERYARELRAALRRVQAFKPRFLVISLGLDPAKADPTGSWSLNAADFETNGRILGALALPTLVVQEGGYRTRSLGTNARRFFTGLAEGAREARA